jgi:hypothetical protein
VSQTGGVHTVGARVHSPNIPLQNSPAGHSQELVQGVKLPPLRLQMPTPETSGRQTQPLRMSQEKGLAGSQEIEFGGIQDSAHMPPLQVPLQH